MPTIGASDGVAFLIGVAVGAAGKYFADKYTDRRRAQEGAADARRRFREVAGRLPKLIHEMAGDYHGEHGEHVREMVLLPNRDVGYNSTHPVFFYYEAEHENLRGQFAILANHGYVSPPIPSRSTPSYEVSEDFAEFLVRYRD